MKTSEKEHFFYKNRDVLILVITVIVGILLAGLEIFHKLDFRLYDALLGLSQELPVDDRIVLIDIDDQSLDEIGSWPWTRDILGNVLLRMKEFGAETAVFDIEYLSPSNRAINSDIGDITEAAFADGEAAIADAVSDFAAAVAAGRIPARAAPAASRELVSDTVDPTLFTMFNRITDNLYKDNDAFFGQTVEYFGNASLTINTRDLHITVSDEDAAYARSRFLFDYVSDPRDAIRKGNDYTAGYEEHAARAFTPALHAIARHAAGAGFTNAVVDNDGSRRRVELLSYEAGGYIGQLAFAPLIRMLRVQSIERKMRTLVLHGALLPGHTERTDIAIPLDYHGRMMINWLHRNYADSFRHVPVYNFAYLDETEADIVRYLTALQHADTAQLSAHDAAYLSYAADVIGEYTAAETLRTELLARCRGFDTAGNPVGGGIRLEEYDYYRELRAQFFDDAAALAALCAQIPGADSIPAIALLLESCTMYQEDAAAMREQLNGAFCLIGNSATASTDLGVTPFARRYPNIGTHANVANTILQRQFIRHINVLWAIAVTSAIAFVSIVLSRSRTGTVRTFYELIYVVVPIGVVILLMVLFKIYITISPLLFIVIVTYVGNLVLNFLITEKDRSTLRRGFNAYVAPEVVSEIVKNPSLLALGGSTKHITALFSDVRTFSGFTEQISREEGEPYGAARLVAILNGYLGTLSDVIMDNRGTIDKYIGDEIVAFFGAPIDNPDNAFDACVAAIRMKQAEARYNSEHAAELPLHPVTQTPFLLKSRVGINTGDMVVGNMGTEKKLNYTIMGNNVNLASRLEGTNKAYDSWIIASESTWREADSGAHAGVLVARQLDCVKVINVETPVQIYSITGLRSELPEAQIEAAELFNQGMALYLKGRETPHEPKNPDDFRAAIRCFEQAYRCYHTTDAQDGQYVSTEQKMILRCEAFLAHGTGPVWDGVYTMTSK